MASDPPISIPQVAACVLIGYLVIRWFFKVPSPGSTDAGSAPRTRQVDPRRLTQQADVVHGMFPQISRAAIEAELQRNGGSVEVTTERILSTGFLPEPPRPATPVRQPAPRPAQQRPNQTGAGATSGAAAAVNAQFPDLITRYNLHDRLREEGGSVPSVSAGGKGKAPASKADRQMAHKAKRDEMVLEARRAVEKMIAAEREQN